MRSQRTRSTHATESHIGKKPRGRCLLVRGVKLVYSRTCVAAGSRVQTLAAVYTCGWQHYLALFHALGLESAHNAPGVV